MIHTMLRRHTAMSISIPMIIITIQLLEYIFTLRQDTIIILIIIDG